MNVPAFAAQDVVKRYGAEAAVDGVSLSARPGETLALLGHNGAGKTTLMKLILGLARPDSGRIEVLGRAGAARTSPETRRLLGFLPENVAFYDGMKGRELLRFYARLKGAPVAACDGLLEQVGLAEAAGKRIKAYSKGMRQRLGLAQALLGEPRLLFLDEPTSGLDPMQRQVFFASIRKMAEAGTAVVLSSHALTELEARTDRIAILRKGRLVAWGSLEELRGRAGLPVRFHIRVPGGAAGGVAERLGGMTVTRVNDHAVDLACAPEDKMEALRHIAGLGVVVEDVEIRPPTLDAIYAHFRGEEQVP